MRRRTAEQPIGRDRPAPRPGPRRRSDRPELRTSGQQVTVRWNGSSVGAGVAAARFRVTTVTVLVSAPIAAVASPASALLATVALAAHFEMSSANVTVYVPGAVRAAAVAPRWSPSVPAAETTAKRVAAAGPAVTMSVAFAPSTRSAFRPVATPVALVVNGAAFVGPSMRPTSVPEFVWNEKARPLDRLLARRHAFVPVCARQP